MVKMVRLVVVWIITSRFTVRLYLRGAALLYLTLHKLQLHRNWVGLAYDRSPSHFWDWVRRFEWTLLNSSRIRHLRKLGKYFPTTQTWFVANECNRKGDDACPGCPTSKKFSTKEMTGDDWLRLGEEFIKNGGRAIQIAGGEPMLEKEMIKRIVAQLGDKVLFIVFTNGDLVTEQDVIDFCRLGIVLAINVYSERKDDTGAIRALELAKKHGAIAGAAITVTQENYKWVTSQACMDKLVSLGAIFAYHFHYVPTGCPEDDQLVLHEDAFWEVERYLTVLKSLLRLFQYSLCRAGYTFASIDPSGDVRLCPFCTGSRSFGNVLESTLLDIFNGEEFRWLRILNKNKACLILNENAVLAEKRFLSVSVREAVDKARYPRGYIRRTRWWRRVIIRLSDWVWGREH